MSASITIQELYIALVSQAKYLWLGGMANQYGQETHEDLMVQL